MAKKSKAGGSVVEQAYLQEGSDEQALVLSDSSGGEKIPPMRFEGVNPFKTIYREAQPYEGIQKYVLGMVTKSGVLLRVVDYNGGSGVSSSLSHVEGFTLIPNSNGETFDLKRK